MVQNPWRKGVAAGEAFARQFEEWREAAKASRDYSNRPEKPANPYPLGMGKGRRAGSYQWETGFQWGVQQQERRIRQAKARAKSEARGEPPRLLY